MGERPKFTDRFQSYWKNRKPVTDRQSELALDKPDEGFTFERIGKPVATVKDAEVLGEHYATLAEEADVRTVANATDGVAEAEKRARIAINKAELSRRAREALEGYERSFATLAEKARAERKAVGGDYNGSYVQRLRHGVDFDKIHVVLKGPDGEERENSVSYTLRGKGKTPVRKHYSFSQSHNGLETMVHFNQKGEIDEVQKWSHGQRGEKPIALYSEDGFEHSCNTVHVYLQSPRPEITVSGSRSTADGGDAEEVYYNYRFDPEDNCFVDYANDATMKVPTFFDLLGQVLSDTAVKPTQPDQELQQPRSELLEDNGPSTIMPGAERDSIISEQDVSQQPRMANPNNTQSIPRGPRLM